MEHRQATIFDTPDDDDGLTIIGVARDAPGTQSHSAFRKIDGAGKAGKFVSFSWGDLMVMLPRSLYEKVFAYAAQPDQESRAAALTSILEQGLTACSE